MPARTAKTQTAKAKTTKTRTAKAKTAGPVYQLKITLKDFRPPIWRRVLAPGDFSLHKLHWVIQSVMGWTNSHLHQFVDGNEYYGEPDPDDWIEMKDEARFKLNQIAPEEKCRFVYEYDFGDSWEHDILVEKILPPDPKMKQPVCLKGKGACPPEDVGGVWGYAEFLNAIADPNHDEHDEYLEWVGGEFDPDAFDLDEVNQYLRQIK